jgi:tetraacyldisaccharide 4'-kinase
MKVNILTEKVLLRDKIISRLIQVVNKKERTRGERAIYFALLVLSRIYGCLISLRVLFFRWGIFRKRSFGCLVISVGNITTGGTGKTPIVEVFARALSKEGRKVAVLTRGYRRHPAKSKNDVLVVQGDKGNLSAYEVGDEPCLLARNLGNIPIVVGKDRISTGEYAISKLGADTLILDDGYQYLSLSNRINIVCVDANRPFGNGNLIPAGFLREPLESLNRANFFFLTKVRSGSDGEVSKLCDRLRSFNKEASIVETCYFPVGLIDAAGGKEEPLENIKGKKIITLSAIADPEGFENLLSESGAAVEETFRFPDHHYFSKDELVLVDKRCRDSRLGMIVMTEKDFVKLPPGFRFKSKAVFLKVEVKITKGADSFTDCIYKLCFK